MCPRAAFGEAGRAHRVLRKATGPWDVVSTFIRVYIRGFHNYGTIFFEGFLRVFYTYIGIITGFKEGFRGPPRLDVKSPELQAALARNLQLGPLSDELFGQVSKSLMDTWKNFFVFCLNFWVL